MVTGIFSPFKFTKYYSISDLESEFCKAMAQYTYMPEDATFLHVFCKYNIQLNF